MGKKMRRIVCFLLIFMLMGYAFAVKTYAVGGLSISTSSQTVSSGDTFTVTVKAANNYFVAGISLSVSGGTVVSNLGANSLDKGESATAMIKLTGDECTVTVTGTGANYDTETEGAASASVTVTKKEDVSNNIDSNTNNSNTSNNNTTNNTADTNASTNTNTELSKSSDSTLSNITVSQGTLSPTFDGKTTAYKVELSADATQIVLDAKANDTGASVSGTGEKTLVAGNNVFSIICQAEDGTEKKYTVNVYVDETPLVYTIYGETSLGVVRNQENIGVPETFEETTIILDEQEVLAYHSDQYNMTIVYLEDEEGKENFYIFEEEKGITSIFRMVSILGRNLVLYDLTEEEQVRENMIYQEMIIDGITLNGWVYEDAEYEDYAHIPVMNEFGEKIIYQYEKTENSLQLLLEYKELEVVKEVDIKKGNISHLYIAIGTSVFFLIITLTLTIKNVGLKKKYSALKRRYRNN